MKVKIVVDCDISMENMKEIDLVGMCDVHSPHHLIVFVHMNDTVIEMKLQ